MLSDCSAAPKNNPRLWHGTATEDAILTDLGCHNALGITSRVGVGRPVHACALPNPTPEWGTQPNPFWHFSDTPRPAQNLYQDLSQLNLGLVLQPLELNCESGPPQFQSCFYYEFTVLSFSPHLQYRYENTYLTPEKNNS